MCWRSQLPHRRNVRKVQERERQKEKKERRVRGDKEGGEWKQRENPKRANKSLRVSVLEPKEVNRQHRGTSRSSSPNVSHLKQTPEQQQEETAPAESVYKCSLVFGFQLLWMLLKQVNDMLVTMCLLFKSEILNQMLTTEKQVNFTVIQTQDALLMDSHSQCCRINKVRKHGHQSYLSFSAVFDSELATATWPGQTTWCHLKWHAGVWASDQIRPGLNSNKQPVSRFLRPQQSDFGGF